MNWKKGRGTLGALAPLIGSWVARDAATGRVLCTRTFRQVLGNKYITLECEWPLGNKTYEEYAIFGSEDGRVVFWSFTSDGKRSQGALADGTDVHEQAIAFEAQMPAGLARMIYWPHPHEGFNWAVESRNKRGWNRFVEHHYLPVKS